MTKTYLEVEFLVPPRAFLLEDNNHRWFIAQLKKLGWSVSPYDISYDLCLVSPSGQEHEMYNMEWLVVYSDGKGAFPDGEVFFLEEFEGRFGVR